MYESDAPFILQAVVKVMIWTSRNLMILIKLRENVSELNSHVKLDVVKINLLSS